MNRCQEVFRALQARARSTAAKSGGSAPTQEYLTRHLLESFLDRLTRTPHRDSFVLKGGILLAAYGLRRPTKDADMNAIGTDVTPDHLRRVVADVLNVVADDGVVFDLAGTSIRQIREASDYPGFRIRVNATIGPWRGVSVWDVSTGDPVIPPPRQICIERILGSPIYMLGYAVETIIAEKGVTILERGASSTRWRDYVDIVRLCRQGFDHDELRRSAQAVANYRGVALEPVGQYLKGYESIGQAKWSAWRRKERVEDVSEADLVDQVALVASYLDPIFCERQGSSGSAETTPPST